MGKRNYPIDLRISQKIFAASSVISFLWIWRMSEAVYWLGQFILGFSLSLTAFLIGLFLTSKWSKDSSPLIIRYVSPSGKRFLTSSILPVGWLSVMIFLQSKGTSHESRYVLNAISFVVGELYFVALLDGRR